MTPEGLALLLYEAYRATTYGPDFHQLTPEQRTAWLDVADEALYYTAPGQEEP